MHFLKTNTEELNIIIKSDVHGSSEAIKFAISNIKHDEVKAKIITFRYRNDYRNRYYFSKSI